MKVLLIDNYDSFTYNLLHLLIEAGAEVDVVRNDQDFLPSLNNGIYSHVVIGPGPGSPQDARYFGKCMQVILQYGTKGLPILGVCLGFQGIACAFGASLKRAQVPMHGKASRLLIHSTGSDGLLKGSVNNDEVMRYHSLMVDASTLPTSKLCITSEVTPADNSVKANGREIMSLQHIVHPIYGVQFHPESFKTKAGHQIIKNFLSIQGGQS